MNYPVRLGVSMLGGKSCGLKGTLYREPKIGGYLRLKNMEGNEVILTITSVIEDITERTISVTTASIDLDPHYNKRTPELNKSQEEKDSYLDGITIALERSGWTIC